MLLAAPLTETLNNEQSSHTYTVHWDGNECLNMLPAAPPTETCNNEQSSHTYHPQHHLEAGLYLLRTADLVHEAKFKNTVNQKLKQTKFYTKNK